MSIASLFGLSVALHAYIGARTLPDLPGLVQPAGLALLLAASALLVPMGLVARRLVRSPAADRLAAAGLLFMGLFSSMLVFTVARDALLLVLWIARSGLPSLPLELLRERTAPAIPVFALAVTAIGYMNARRTAGVVTVDVRLPELPPSLEGFTIVQITDVHVGPTIRRRYVQAIVEAVNRLQPDVVAITGDLVDGTVPELAGDVEPLCRLAPADGSYFVTGNHEYYSGVTPWLAELQRLGVKVLHNEHVVVERGGAKLVLAGVTDYSAGYFEPSHRSDPRAAMAGAPADAAVRILLAHQPRSAAAAVHAGFDLQLSGHTHGGQFLPWNFFVRLQQPFTAGLHRVGRMRVYVSRGTGYWGPPKRVGAPSEITRVRLVRGHG